MEVGGRSAKANIPEDMKFLIILPYKSHVRTLLIRNIHVRLAHSGRNHVLSELRGKYWVIHQGAHRESRIIFPEFSLIFP